MKIPTAVHTKNDVVLYYRDPLECLQGLMRSPLLKDHIALSPFHLYESAAKVMRIYTEWLSGDCMAHAGLLFYFICNPFF